VAHRELRQRARDVVALERRLLAEGLLAPGAPAGDADALAVGLAAFAARSPAPLVALGIDDLAGEREPINLPGVAEIEYPSWVRRAGRDLRDTFARPAARAALERARRERQRTGRPA
jgi:4-alpha-glucanotransferase